jgi:hypothetical protein
MKKSVSNLTGQGVYEKGQKRTKGNKPTQAQGKEKTTTRFLDYAHCITGEV